MAVVSTSCCTKPSARTMVPMGTFSKQPATPAFSTSIRVVEADEQLGAHGGVDLADAAAAGDDMGADLIKGHARLRADGSAGLVCQQRLYFTGHGVYQTNGHDGVPP